MMQNEIQDLFIDLKKLIQDNEQRILSLKFEFKQLNESLEAQKTCPELRRDWVPRHELMQFLQFGPTQMAALTKKYGIEYSEIGKKKFYNINSARKVLESNLINKKVIC